MTTQASGHSRLAAPTTDFKIVSMLVNICIHCGRGAPFIQRSAAELTPHMTLSLQCATRRRFTLKRHQILFITENEIFLQCTGTATPAREGLDVCAHADCAYSSIFPPFEVKTAIHTLSEEVFLPLRKVTGKSTAQEGRTFSPDDANLLFLAAIHIWRIEIMI